MKPRAIITIIAAVVAIAIAVIWYVRRGAPPSTAPDRAPATAAGSGSSVEAPRAGSGSGSGGAAPKRAERLPDRATHDRLLDQIRTARAKASAGGGGTAGSAPPPTLPESPISKDYIRASVREIVPLLTECYETALEKNPALAGNLVVDFTIEGEDDLGGVIGSSTILEDGSDIADAGMRECVQETMYAVKIDAPPDGGVVHVHYPFAFRSAP